MKVWIDLIEHVSNDDIRLDGDMIVAKHDGRDAGWFSVVDHGNNKISLHANVDPASRRLGLATKVYNWAINFFKQQGKTIIPYDRLSPEAYQMWKQRDPESVADYEFRHANWYSPRGIDKWKIDESLDTKLNWRWISKGTGLSTAMFEVPYPDGTVNGFVYLGGSQSISVQFVVNASQGITGKGMAGPILGTVADIIIDFLNSRSTISSISFSAKKHHPSRVRLYKRLSQRLATATGMEWDEDDSQDKDVTYTCSRG